MNADSASIEPAPVDLTARDFWRSELFSKAQSTTMPNFLNEYTLHDSDWQDVHLDTTDQTVVALFSWDTHWSKGRIEYPPFQHLFIHFKSVFHILFGGDQTDGATMDTIGGAVTRVIDDRERDNLVSLGVDLGLGEESFEHCLQGELHLTTIDDILQGHVNLVHRPEISVLCIHSETGDFINIPDL